MPPQNNLKNNEDYPGTERAFRAGTIIANPSPGEEVVITGMAGRFPDSDDIYEFRKNLLNKRDMVSDDDRRWKKDHPEIPHRTGKINFFEKLDAGFFGMHYRQAEAMDPICRQLLERAYETILDAGFHPDELRGTNTGVFIAVSFPETEKAWFFEKLESPTYAMTGCARSMLSQRVSYFLGLEGPSHVVDTACSSSLYALEHAYRAIRSGRCDGALVGAANVCLHPYVSLEFARLGVLSLDGSCKSFDASANGYARSEAAAVIYLQKQKDARRIYAQIVHTKANSDGHKEEGITFPSHAVQKRLLNEIYQECSVDPGTVDFVEAHATGTKVGDLEEVIALDEVFCVNRKTPLLIGSVKSNLGHSEPASGICSIVKVLLGMENNYLFPNLNYLRPKEEADALGKGRMVVVTETTPWPKDGSGLAAINSFGFGGSNCHVLLRKCIKQKVDCGQPKDDLPRLVCVSGRTKESIASILDDVSHKPLDTEFIGILQKGFRNALEAHPFRGFLLTSKTEELVRSCKWFDGKKQSLCLICDGPNQIWVNIARQLFAIPLFAATIQKIDNVLSPKGVDILKIVNEKYSRDAFGSNTVALAFQAALIDVLKAVGLSPDYIVGESLGELIAAYVDDALTLEQTVLSAYHIEKYLSSTNEKSATIDREEQSQKLFQTLKDIIPKPKQRTSKWISSYINKTLLPDDVIKYASAEYFTNISLSPVPLDKIEYKISPKTVIVMFRSVSNGLPNCHIVNLLPAENQKQNSLHSLLQGLGRLYEMGYNLSLDKLYPPVQWPVSSGTRMVSPLIKWNHSDDWFVVLFNAYDTIKTGEREISFSIKDRIWAYLAGHVIDGRTLIPATCYLVAVWETLAMLTGSMSLDTQVVFEDVKFHRATNISANAYIVLTIGLQRKTTRFVIEEMGQTIVSGKIYIPENFSEEVVNLPLPANEANCLQLSSEDIYKELKLRGYNYSGAFQALKSCEIDASQGMVEWTGNWVTFIDNMFQLAILQEDTRTLYIPTGIERLAIDARAHVRYAKTFEDNSCLPVYSYKESGIIRSGFIEMRSLHSTAISRRKPLGNLVLETQQFIPLEAELSLEKSIRVFIQIFIENNYSTVVRTVELIDQGTDEEPLSPFIYQALNDQPVIQSEVTVFSNKRLELDSVTVEDKTLSTEARTCSLVVVSNMSVRPQVRKEALSALKENGVIVSRESLNFESTAAEKLFFGLDILALYRTGKETLVLLRTFVSFTSSTVIDISRDLTCTWLPTLQATIKNKKQVILLAQNAPLNGILGFVNCLRRENRSSNIRCVFIMDDVAPKFDPVHDFYSQQLKKGLFVNVLKNGRWGTYRHLLLEKELSVRREHVFCNVTLIGDLSSLRWIEGPLTSESILPPGKSLVHIYWASLNFRDIMIASGRIGVDVIIRDRIEQYNVQGFEFAGRDSSGKRVMGMLRSGALASMTTADSYLLWEIPDDLSMEDAATLPVAYGTVIFSFITVAQIKPGQSILIHAGSGAVGQAAINVALFYKCNIFTTVGTEAKRNFIRKTFPQIPERHIGNSRDTSFKRMVLQETNGRGVDIILNSLADEKLEASLRCLAPGGKFLEIGKFDLAKDSPLRLGLLTEGRSFHSVMLDVLYEKKPQIKSQIGKVMIGGLKTGMIKPLNRTIFERDEVEKAFRYMAGGRHIGKVLLHIRKEEDTKEVVPKSMLFEGIPRFYGNPDKCYVIAGGLGGIGVELADWLVIRGARKLVLVSRSGVTNGYQASRIRIWKSYGATIKISTADITTNEGCSEVLNEANEVGPVEGIFNLAVVLKDALLENQNQESFIASLAPKAFATQHFDVISRKICPELQYFVVFSSVVAGRGNIGQTNYGLANSVMERICEKRKQDGYPALAIQWGAVGEVGLVAEMQGSRSDIEIGGTLPQRIASCLDMLDVFMRQSEPVVSSMVLPDRKDDSAGAGGLVESVKSIMGMKDLKSISLHSTLSELGMDSIMAVEVKQALERTSEVLLTAQDIRNMTFARLQEIANEKASKDRNENNENNENDESKATLDGLQLLLRFTVNEENSTVPLVKLASRVQEKDIAPNAFFLPGIDGMANLLEPLASNLFCHAFCLQFTYSDQPETAIFDIAKSLLYRIKESLPNPTPFTLIGYSYGCIVAIELAALLETEGRLGRVILIDGSPGMFQEVVKRQLPEANSEDHLQTRILCGVLQFYISLETILKHTADILHCKTLEERVSKALSLTPENSVHSKRFQRQVFLAAYYRFKSLITYQPTFGKLKSIIKLIKPSQPLLGNFDEDYKLQELCENVVEVDTYDGHHTTLLNNLQVADAINATLESASAYSKQPILKSISSLQDELNVGVKQI